MLQYADVAQQAFSSDAGTTLHLAILALKALHKAWSFHSGWPKYAHFAPALHATVQKIDEYYEQTTDSPTYVMAMCSFFQYLIQWGKWPTSKRTGQRDCRMMCLLAQGEWYVIAHPHILVHFSQIDHYSLKLVTLKWENLCQCHNLKKGKASGVRKLIHKTQSPNKDKDSGPLAAAAATDLTRPWRAGFTNYLNTTEAKPPLRMTIIQW
jgi:hypothetical protein